ncbi:MAG: Nramp family divalent metal transporter [Pseudomonadota bacterium]
MSLLARLKSVGPGALVTAAFIGPGTVTVCTLAGARFGYSLLWALLFATIATIIFQEMACRLGTVTGRGLGESLQATFGASLWRWPLALLVLTALYAGNAAYEAGNLSGAALGASAIFGESVVVFRSAVLCTVAIAAIVLLRGSHRQVERVLIGLVIVMAIAFVSTFIAGAPQWSALLRGLLVPAVPEGSLITIVALIGTTVVPYNLFLHAAAAKLRYRGTKDLPAARTDTVVSIGLGGLVAIFIVSTAAAGLFANGLAADNATDMARQFEPLFGVWSRYLLGVGLLAAGVSSALTAPLATAYAVNEVLRPGAAANDGWFRVVSMSVLLVGAAFALSGIRPIQIILTAQFANGLLLPIIAGFLLYAMNQRGILGDHVNTARSNTLGGIVFVVAVALGARSVLRATGFM